MTGKIDRQTAFSGTSDVRQGHEFDIGALEAYLAEQIDGFCGPLSVEQFKGGQSNPTYKLSSPSGRYVLRRKPPGKLLPSAHAVDREYRVISALHPIGFPVARPYLLCEDDGVIGTSFYVMGFADGRVFWNPYVPDVEETERAGIYDAMNQTIARLHMVDVEAVGLADFGKPQGYVARQVARWSKQYQASETEKIGEMDRLMDWLPDAAPETDEVALVHGDFRLDNCIVAHDAPRILAVLDWELSTLGDPLADFTYHLMQWMMPPSETGAGVGSLVEHLGTTPGLPALEDYVAAYCERTGRSGISNLDNYMAYNFFRLAAIFQGIVGRVRDGTAASPNAAAIANLVQPMSKVAWDFALKAGA
ncbi:MAG: phosphotransferase family protein [Hyphomicrobiales bacterium]|nr:phosphotransferase family protein [Hyphomicrobiales bacterium]